MRVPGRRSFLVLVGTAAAAVASACAQTPPAATPKPAEPAGAQSAAAKAPAEKPPEAKPAVAAPAPAGQVTTLKMQSGFGAKDLFHVTLVNWGKKVEEMSGGRLKVDVLASGAVVGPFQMIDAVHQGVLDGALGVPAYWFGKSKALSLFGTGPSLGMDADLMLGWMEYGGGKQLYEELIQRKLNLSVVSFFGAPMPSQPLGWFKTEITKPDDFKGMKYRTVGMAQDLFGLMGASVQAIGGADVVPSLERGVIDAAEFNNPISDRVLGLPDVRKVLMAGSYHQQSEFLEWQFNKQKFDALPADFKAILKYASWAQSSDFTWTMQDGASKDLAEMKTGQGVKVVKTAPSLLQDQLKAWDEIIKKEEAADPFFKQILDSQRAWARRTLVWRDEILTDGVQSLAAKHWGFASR
jgi:TRAP-type mannitol/chloroaromatic compound transport system substrate-binding protein